MIVPLSLNFSNTLIILDTAAFKDNGSFLKLRAPALKSRVSRCDHSTPCVRAYKTHHPFLCFNTLLGHIIFVTDSFLHRVRSSRTWTFTTMLVSALISLSASFVLSVDALILAANPDANLSCNINAVISCGTVGNSWQASLFGFPNAFLGLIAEPVVITIAVASLGGVRFPRWFMMSAQFVYTLGVIFAYWLFAQSLLYIHALCPWCLLVTLSTTLVFTTLTHFNALEENLLLPGKLKAPFRTFFVKGYDLYALFLWLCAFVAIILIAYGPRLLS